MTFRCPRCGYEHDQQECLTSPKATPRPGDLTVCIRCAELLVFDGQGGVRQPTDGERAEYEPEVQIAELRRAIQIINQRRNQ